MVHMVNGTQMDSIIYNNNRQFRSGVNMRTGRCCCDSVFSQRKTVYVYEQPKMPTAVKATFWSIAIKNFADIGMGIANFFMGIFGKKKASAPVQTPAATQNNKVTPDKQGVNTPTSPVVTPKNATTPQEVNDPEKEDNNNKKQTKEKKYNVPSSAAIHKFTGNVIVHDDGLGDKGDITGDTKISTTTKQNGYPASITVGQYKYTLERVDKDGTVWYKSQNGNGQLYRLEKNNDGSIGLNQHAEDNGVGKADVSKWRKPSSAASEKKEVKQAEKKETPAGSQGLKDEELKDTMHIGREISDFTNTKWGTDGKAYFPTTVTYGLAPEGLKTIKISAEEVAECQGDDAKIKDLALKKIREKEQPESQKAE